MLKTPESRNSTNEYVIIPDDADVLQYGGWITYRNGPDLTVRHQGSVSSMVTKQNSAINTERPSSQGHDNN